ncbi:hypothetical protein DFH29DRAFT_881296 [Suillus ampliporus]|nr:hypothetical protein DFH29DRAFT_881296 [Suillus ampliporus]
MVPAVQTTVRHIAITSTTNLAMPNKRRLILSRLNGEEFDRVAQMMVGGSLGVGEAIWDPKPDEVLDSNRLMLSAFCENRDRLTRIFKDLISLHHMAQVQERVMPIVNTLLEEVERAEALIADSE